MPGEGDVSVRGLGAGTLAHGLQALGTELADMRPAHLPTSAVQLGDGIEDETHPLVGGHVGAGDQAEGLAGAALAVGGLRDPEAPDLDLVRSLREAPAQEAGGVVGDGVDLVDRLHDEAPRGDVAARGVSLVDVVGVGARDDPHVSPRQLASAQHPAQGRSGEEPVGVDRDPAGSLQPQGRQETAQACARAQGDGGEAHVHPEASEGAPRRGLDHPFTAQEDLAGTSQRLPAPVREAGGGQQGAPGVGRQGPCLAGTFRQTHRHDDDLVKGCGKRLDLLLEELLPYLVGVKVGQQQEGRGPLGGAGGGRAHPCSFVVPVVVVSSWGGAPSDSRGPLASKRRAA
ncbi:MAG: hypothetical protein Q605_AUC00969G0002 [Actinomyces urogenitalis DORA_12]|uniref:Uncharacterized protein n=1 Tax=Actinomyces urogenitalis DORA_12 TaxID=1403939 RepID=W1V9F4_9ACTO|nr:MAG: hypothetical protein Q605_AUC00969G0002 [Actinomyces urogenitalis DORA_12]